MHIIENPPVKRLMPLQEMLERERAPGIVDIWVCVKPYYLAIEHDGDIVGVASISMGEDVAEIYKIYVLPNHRRSGFGKALFGETLNRLFNSGISEILVETASAEGFALVKSSASNFQLVEYGPDKYGIQLNVRTDT
ncbi:GNAT family N-acetyltransferase [Ideonella sp. B7]|uniref:GNAT family N-acetyltransferase n=1 Tax=Ideonella benzenivorans TaxID=2831643 RepID=UPI001CECBE11|nr:GNAT family N-acetyltransferase [Ideonella benzenivorans]MCA6217045.1 GNAT family N-acetyltransferase [Ideonella benzenivorans]